MSEKESSIFESNIVDINICDRIGALNKICAFHKKLVDENITAPGYFPEEIMDYAPDLTYLNRLWEEQNYNQIRYEYAKIWVDFYEIKYNNEAHFTAKDFSLGKAQRTIIENI